MKKNKLIDLFFIVFLSIILLCGAVKPIIRPLTINETENRAANQIPSLSISAIFDKTFQDQYETAMADQIPFATQMKLTEKSAEILMKLGFFQLTEDSNRKLNNGILYNDGYLIAETEAFSSETKEGLDSKIQNLNHVIKQLGDIDCYVYYIEKDEDINYITDKKSNFYDYIVKRLDKNYHTKKYSVNHLDEYKEFFFKTDHHWNHKGAYAAYSDIVNWMGLGNLISKGNETCSAETFTGSRDALIGGNWLFKEPYCVYSYEFAPHNISIKNEAPVLKRNSEELTDDNIGYGAYYGWDVGLIQYDFFQESKENLLIIGNSFDNAINELLASHFNHTYNVDLRHYENDMQETFNIYQFVKERKIDKVLFIGNFTFFVNDTFNLKGGN